MSIVRVVFKPDKSVVVLHYASKSKLAQQEAFARMMDKNGLTGLGYDDMESSALPSREYRDAWEGEKGKGVKINNVRTKEVGDAKERKRLIEEEKEKLAIESLKSKGEL